MKLFAAFAALVVILQAQSQPRSRTQVLTTAPATVAPIGAEAVDVLNAERLWAGADVLLPIAQKGGASRDNAIRALGRLEDPTLVPSLFGIGGSPAVTAAAIAQSLYGFDPALNPDLLQRVWEWMWTAAGSDLAAAQTSPEKVGDVALPIGSIRWADAEQVRNAERLLATLAGATANDRMHGGQYSAAIHGLEALARVNAKLVQFDDTTVRRLSNSVQNVAANDDAASARLYAFMALAAAHGLKTEVIRKALTDDDWQIRRAAMQFIAGKTGDMEEVTRIALSHEGLRDASPHVRYETLRAYALHAAATEGCQPLLDALTDTDVTVALEAMDALGDQCKGDEDVTTRVATEVRTPPVQGPWQREAHAYVSLARRDPDRAAIATEAFVTHSVWWVRLYAAYAAAAMKDLTHLEKLAYDTDDNVREAALAALRRLDKEKGLRAAEDALQTRGDVQLLRTAATLLKEQPSTPRLSKVLLAGLQRLTKDGRITSRDARTEILDAIERHIKPDDHTDLAPWLRDFDPKVADRAAQIMSRVSGKAFAAEPQPRPHAGFGQFDNLDQCVVVEMALGPSLHMRMLPSVASVAVEQFLTMATKDKYYDGLTFHRVVPNFVIQGGSPGANEYSGARDYMRDEIGRSNVRGTVGLSTRGRNTADAQFFINLVDNPRLDGNYTVFADIAEADMVEIVDRIQEGDVIQRMRTVSCGAKR